MLHGLQSGCKERFQRIMVSSYFPRGSTMTRKGESSLPFLLSRIGLAISVPVLPISDAVHCNRLCSALQPLPQCTASVLAVHCIRHCSALRGKGDSFLKWIPVRLVPIAISILSVPGSKALCLSSLGEPPFVQSKHIEVSLWKTKRLRCKPHLQRSLSHALSEYVTLRSYRSESYHLQHRDYATSRAPSWPSLEDRRDSTHNPRETHAA